MKQRKKKENPTREILYSVGALLLIFMIYFWFVREVPIVTVSILDESDEEIHSQVSGTFVGANLMQSMFGGTSKLSEYLIQSQIPLDRNAKMAVFKVVVSPPKNQGEFKLEQVRYYKNGDLVDARSFTDIFLAQGASFLYTSNEIDVQGLEAQRNEIVLLFDFVHVDTGVKKNVTYEYEYLTVTRCQSDDDCPPVAPSCDIANAARFSTDANVHYCTRPCGAHMDCPEGQICIMGVCGY